MHEAPRAWQFWTLPKLTQDTLRVRHSTSAAATRDFLRSHAAPAISPSATNAPANDVDRVGLFALLAPEPDPTSQERSAALPEHRTPITWATESYFEQEHGDDYHAARPLHDLEVIRPRAEKSAEERRSRSKQKAEVFTPAWVVNIQNNLVDSGLGVAPSAPFNYELTKKHSWLPTGTSVRFLREYGTEDPQGWLRYVTSRRLEMCCGEGPYLFSSYDAGAGDVIPVRDEEERFLRVGILDRKLRVVFENVSSFDSWRIAARVALRSTYGFEWQGDNLLLARLNMVNTYFDYMTDFCAQRGVKWREHVDAFEEAQEIAEIASWQLWQMDGLNLVLPNSCEESCDLCRKPKSRRDAVPAVHEGEHPLVRWGSRVVPFQALLRSGS